MATYIRYHRKPFFLTVRGRALHLVPLGGGRSSTASFGDGTLSVTVFHGDPDAAGGGHLPLGKGQGQDAPGVVGIRFGSVRRFGEADGARGFSVGALDEMVPVVVWIKNSTRGSSKSSYIRAFTIIVCTLRVIRIGAIDFQNFHFVFRAIF